ncbi:MAG: alpha-amylase [Anaerolineae bacterium]|nr:alpha-amylase [Anaerolineae bacterium]
MPKLPWLLVVVALLGVLSLPGQAQTAPVPWSSEVYYEIFVRSFYDSDGDGIGDLQGIIEKLDYLNDGDPTTTDDLGVTGLWLMPINPSPSYHGYDVTDYYAINPDYGTLEDFRALLEAAHARGMRVLIDLVINHTSRLHPWFVAAATDPNSPYREYYRFLDEVGPGGSRIWHANPAWGGYYLGIFWEGMPDLNYENPAVTEEIQAITRFWLEEVGVDGFRLDAIKHLVEEGRALENTPATYAWMADYHDFVQSVAPEALLVGEAWSSTVNVVRYIGNGVDLAFEFDLALGMVGSANTGIRNSWNQAMQLVLDQYPPGQYATFLTNHDQDRVMSVVREREGAAKVAATLLLTSPGVPFIYYGEEIGMVGRKPDPRLRTPMQWDRTPITAGFTTANRPWEPLQEGIETRNVATQDADPNSLLNYYRTLVHFRNAQPALQFGSLAPLETDSLRVIAYLRQWEGETLLVLVNLDDEPLSDYALALESGLAGPVEAVEVLFGEAGEASAPEVNAAGGFAGYRPLPELPAQSGLVLKLE